MLSLYELKDPALALPYLVTLLVYGGLVGQDCPPAALYQPHIGD